MRPLLLLTLTLTLTHLFAAEVEPHQILATRGKELKSEAFDDKASIEAGNKAGWNIYKGKFEIADKALKVSEQKGDNHPASISTGVSGKNLVIQCKVKLNGAKFVCIGLNGAKGEDHLFRAIFSKTSLAFKKITGPSGRMDTVAEKRQNFDETRFFTLYIEIVDKEVCAQVPELNYFLIGEYDAFGDDKGSLELLASGDNALFKDIKIWEAEKNPKWPQFKAALKQK